MKKTITIEEKEDGSISLEVPKGVKWSTFITGIEMLIEVIKENAGVPIDIDMIAMLNEKNNSLQERINKAIEYYETYKQEVVIGRNKDEKLIKDYYLPAQCSKKLIEILKEERNK